MTFSELFHLPKLMTQICCNIYETRGGWGREGAGKNGDIRLSPPEGHICFFSPTTASLVPRIVFEMLNKYLLNTCMQVQRYVSI